MKIKIQKSELISALNRCVPVAPQRSTMPILSAVKMTADGPGLGLVASDLVVSVDVGAFCVVVDAGAVCVDAKALYDRVKLMPEAELTLDATTGSDLKIKANGSSRRYTIMTTPAEEYPEVTFKTGGVEVPTDALLDAITKAGYSVATDESSGSALHAAMLELDSNGVTVKATDGRRCAIGKAVADGLCDVGALVPLKGLSVLRKSLAGAGEKVTLDSADERLFANFGDYQMSVLLSTATFPPLEKVVPPPGRDSVTTNRSELLDAVKAVAVVTDGVAMKFTLSNDSIAIAGETAATGDAADKVECCGELGGKHVVGMNAQYVIDALVNIPDNEVRLEFGGEMDPLSIRPVDDDGSFVAVLMPMRLK